MHHSIRPPLPNLKSMRLPGEVNSSPFLNQKIFKLLIVRYIPQPPLKGAGGCYFSKIELLSSDLACIIEERVFFNTYLRIYILG